MALQDILKKILEASEKEATEIQVKNEQDKKDLVKKIKASEEASLEGLSVKTTEALELIDIKIQSMARRENKKQVLEAKRNLVAKALELLLESLESADDVLYGDVLTKLFAGISETSGKIVAPKDRLALTQKLAPKGFEVETGDLTGGFILKTDQAEIDNTFKVLVYSEFRPELEMYFAENLKLV